MDTINLLISFDTTGSMYPVLAEVRRRVAELGRQLFDKLDIRIAVIAHGDYCDERVYVTKALDFTSDPKTFESFVRDVKQTGGGDADECYELVLHEARSLSWSASSKRIMLLIGDANPHGPSYALNRAGLVWQNEADMLGSMGVRVHCVHALPSRSTKPFYETVAKKTGGHYLQLDQFADIYEVIVASALREESEERAAEYVKTVPARNATLRRTLEIIVAGRVHKVIVEDAIERSARPDGLVPVKVGAFQSTVVSEDSAIRDYVTALGLTFKKGNGFYQWTKREEVQDYKRVVVRDNDTGDFFTGDAARRLAKLPEKGIFKGLPPSDARWSWWVESTSVNRKLIKGTTFLYLVAEDML